MLIIADVQFVQSLSNPAYLQYLASQKYYDDEDFVRYLKYLLYFREPEYLRYMQYVALLQRRSAIWRALTVVLDGLGQPSERWSWCRRSSSAKISSAMMCGLLWSSRWPQPFLLGLLDEQIF